MFPEAAARLRPGLEREVDVLVRYDMFQRATEKERRELPGIDGNRLGLVALHHSIVSHPDWPDYARLIGGRWLRAPETIDGREWSKIHVTAETSTRRTPISAISSAAYSTSPRRNLWQFLDRAGRASC